MFRNFCLVHFCVPELTKEKDQLLSAHCMFICWINQTDLSDIFFNYRQYFNLIIQETAMMKFQLGGEYLQGCTLHRPGNVVLTVTSKLLAA